VIGGITSGTIFASTFASHIHRVQGILDAAYRHGKKVVLLGRTMVNNLKIAEELGVIDIPDGLLVAENNIRKVRRDKLIVICTGSQGESLAALARMAAAEHPIINVEQGDTVLLASSLIPGNEKTITELINKLLTQGANVISSANAKVHCSGHANQGELRYIYNVVRPKNVLPIHGEVQHLLANAAVAKETGVPPERIPIIKSGGIVDLRDGRAQVVGRIENGYIFVDGASIGEVSDDDLKNRKMLSAEGFIAITATVDLNSHKVIARPKVVARAVAEDDVVFEKLPEQIQIALEREMSKNHAVDTNRLTYVTKKAVQKFVTKTLRRNPMILPIVSII
jgi:ribonuclease J